MRKNKDCLPDSLTGVSSWLPGRDSASWRLKQRDAVVEGDWKEAVGSEGKLYSLSDPQYHISLPLWPNDEDLYMQLSLLGAMKTVQH